MTRLLDKKAWRTIGFVAVATIGLSGSWTTVSAQSPENEIARLNRVRANLFEELVKTRAEAAAARAELDAAIKAREHAEAELARLKQEAASAKPTSPPPVRQTSVGPQQQVPTDTSTKPQSRPAVDDPDLHWCTLAVACARAQPGGQRPDEWNRV